jgi:hypothetical protein
MGSGGPDTVHVDVAGDLVEISWAEREELLERVRIVAGDKGIVSKFTAAGARGPVELGKDEIARLRMTLELWDAVALGDLPDGIAGLLTVVARAHRGGRGSF